MSFLTNSLAAGFVAASLASSPAMAAKSHPLTGEPLAGDQTFTYRLLDEHSSLDPQIVEDVSGADIVRDLFEGLMNQDSDGRLIPGVATRFETNESKNVYTFYLRDNAKWSDGKPVTASDFVYAWRRLADPKTASPYSWFAELMSIEGVGPVLAGEAAPDTLGVAAVDDLTFEVRLSASLPYFALMTTHGSTFPSPRWAIEKHGDKWTKPGNIVSNGAYVLTEHIPQERSVRERNSRYWNNDATIINKVVSLVINDENTALTRYLAGELDRTEIPAGQYPRLAAKYPDQASSFPRLCSYYYTFNVSDSGPAAFKDIRVRQALSYAIDRDVITDKILQGGQFAAYTFTPGTTANFDIPVVAYAGMSQSSRDAKAVELMTEAGYGADNPLSFNMIYNTSDAHKKIAIAMAQMWKQKLGVKVEMANMEWKTFLEVRGRQDFDLARGAWCGDYNEASTFLDLVTSASGYNDGKFSNAEVDALMASAKTMADPSANYTRVEQIMADEMPIVPIYHYTSVYMLNSALKNWPVKNVEQNWYSRDLYKVAK
ncbi:MAG: peptide ABC transporter substrate-binding protein [Gammaproteobacteria bacterium]|nr:peptide ABC transporter substrate-binding protein [Gammaproteobacteria bacterium]